MLNILNFNFTCRSSLVAAIRNIQYEGRSSNTALGIFDARTSAFIPPNEEESNRKGDREGVTNIALLVTDGPSDMNQQNTIRYANDSKMDGITLLVLGLTLAVDEEELNAISSSGVQDDTYWMAGDYLVTNLVIDDIVDQICTLSQGEDS